MPDFDAFESPFSTRYGSPAMRALWSERNKRRLWRRVWVALAQAQHELGLVSAEQAADLAAHADEVTDTSIARAHAIEREIQHDLMAEVRAYAEQCQVGGGIIHLGATSMDVEDNADALRLRDALALIERGMAGLIRALAQQVQAHAHTPAMAFTHLQPAEPTTIGYRLAQHLQDALDDLDALRRVRVRGKGIKGAVGTSAAYLALTGEAASGKGHEIERRVLQQLGLDAFPVATQTYPRKQDWHVLNVLAGLAQTLYKFAFDLRVLQSPPIGEWSEPFGAKQVGSSAMPFKRNPITAEKINSLARYLAALPRVAWDNAAHSLLERTLDDSANRRTVLPEAFLAADEIIRAGTRLVRELRIHEAQVRRTMLAYGPFAATERLLMALVRAGADRQVMHEVVREHSMAAWAAVQAGQPNPLVDLLARDPAITGWLGEPRTRELLDAGGYVGDAPERALALAQAALAQVGEIQPGP